MPRNDVETRRLAAGLAEVRIDEPDSGEASSTVIGYAALFDVETVIAGSFRERIMPGAFAAAIQRDDIHALLNHDYNLVLGRRSSGTLRLKEDDKGLRVEIDMPDTQTARDLVVSMQRGDVDQMSFGFVAVRQSWDDTAEPPLRTLEEVELWDVSIAPRGAYDQTEAALRDLRAAREAAKETGGSGAVIARLRMKQGLRARGIR